MRRGLVRADLGELLPARAFAAAPAVLFLPGSGPTDREDNQPLALVADLLEQIAARLGPESFCLLRFDKRAGHVYKTAWPSDDALVNDFFR